MLWQRRLYEEKITIQNGGGIAFILLLSLAFVACSSSDDDSGSGGGGGNVPQKIDETPITADGTIGDSVIIKNEVQNFFGLDGIYYEYLEFKSGADNIYSVYKKGETTNEKVTELTLTKADNSTEKITLPTTFTYDSTTNELSAGSPAVKSYLFKTGSTYITAEEKLTTTASPVALCAKWSDSQTPPNSYTVDKSGSIWFDLGEKGTTAAFYKNNSGYLSSDTNPISFAWLKVGDEASLYSFATKAQSVDAVGRSARTNAEKVVYLKSNRFLLIK